MPLGPFLLAWVIRALPFGRVFDENRTVFLGNDAWYHMHRVRESLAAGNWPAISTFDPMVNWPHGARPIWTPLFDAFVAGVALPFHAISGIAAAESAAAWVPPILGALCVVVLYYTAREVADEATARIAGAVLSVLVGHTWYAQVGFVDHHVAVTLLAAWMLLAAVKFTRAPGRPTSVLLSACEAIAVLLWPGAILHVALVELGLSLALAQRPANESSVAQTSRVWGHTFAFLLVAPFCFGQTWPQWGAYSATVLSHFQPLLFAALAAHAATVARFAGKAPGPGRRFAGTVGLGLAVLVACLGVFPGLREAALEAWSWFGRAEAFQANVTESEPLFFRSGEFTWGPASVRLSWFLPALPLAWLAFMRDAWRQRQSPALVFGVWAIGILLSAGAQTRFAHSASLAVALLIAWSLRALLPTLAQRISRPVATAALAALALLGLAPSLELHATTLSYSLAGKLTTSHHGKLRLLATADWLRANSGGTRTGVLAPWHLGHPILYTAGLPTVVGNFGDDVGPENFELTQTYFRSLEPRAARLLDQLDARFVIIESLSARNRDQFGVRTMYYRLHQPILRDLTEHRLRYASPSDERPLAATSYRVFERVAGARVEGRAEPGSLVTARMRVGRPGSAIGLAVVVAEAGTDGRYVLRLAQAGKDGIGGSWQIEADERTEAVAVPLDAVLKGLTLVGPDFGSTAN